MNPDAELALPPLPQSVTAGRIPTWNIASTHHRSCPVCDDDVPRFVCRRPDHLRVACCAQCGMVYLPETPNAEEIVRFYESYGTFKLLSPRRLPWFQLLRASLSDRHIAILKRTGGLQGASLIDIGCSFGRFLQLARHCGAKIAGVELDDTARHALQRLGIACRKTLNADEKVDIICAFQLIEHLENPGTLLGQISESLVDDGRLLLALPNGGECGEVGESWLGFRVDLEHFNYFSIKTLSRLLARFGLFLDQFWLHSQPAISRNVTRHSASGRIPSRISRLAQRLFSPPSSLESFDSGTFVLTALARKIPNEYRSRQNAPRL